MIRTFLATWCLFVAALGAAAAEPASRPATYFPPPESRGGWRSLVPANQEPTAQVSSHLRL